MAVIPIPGIDPRCPICQSPLEVTPSQAVTCREHGSAHLRLEAGEYRWASTSTGTNLTRLEAALAALGVDPTVCRVVGPPKDVSKVLDALELVARYSTPLPPPPGPAGPPPSIDANPDYS